MNLPRNLIAAGAMVLTMAAATEARAGIFNISAFDNGAYQLGFHGPASGNIFVGTNVEDEMLHNFFAFDLAPLSGLTVTSATLTVFGGNGTYFSAHSSETYGLFNYTGNINNLLDGTGGLVSHADLGSGTPYGQVTVAGPSTPYTHLDMPELSISLSPAAVADINAILALVDKRFVIGGALLSHAGGTLFGESLFFASDLLPAGKLTLLTPLSDNPLPPVPIPSALPLFATGLGVLALLARLKRATARGAD
jgi:hypothetical protein